MVTDNKTTVTETVTCKVCLKELPRTNAKEAETKDYVLYFCGLDCYKEWQKKICQKMIK